MSQTKEYTIMMAGSAACRAALDILYSKEESLKKRYSRNYLTHAEEKLKSGMLSDKDAEELLKDISPEAFCLCEEDGVFAALYMLGEKLDCGLKVKLKSIPIDQAAIELCDLTDINPYESDSRGSVILAVKNAGKALELSEKYGIALYTIGFTSTQNARIVAADTERYLTPRS